MKAPWQESNVVEVQCGTLINEKSSRLYFFRPVVCCCRIYNVKGRQATSAHIKLWMRCQIVYQEVLCEIVSHNRQYRSYMLMSEPQFSPVTSASPADVPFGDSHEHNQLTIYQKD